MVPSVGHETGGRGAIDRHVPSDTVGLETSASLQRTTVPTLSPAPGGSVQRAPRPCFQGHNEPRDRLILGAGIRSPPEEDAGWPRRRPRSNHYKGRKVRRRRRAGRGDRREGDRHWGNDTTSLHTVHLRESDLRKRFGLRTKRIDSVRTIAVWSFEKRITYRPGPPFEDLAWRERGHARREAVRRQSRLVAARLNRMRHVVVFLCALQIATAVSRHKRKRFAQYEGAGDSTSILRYIERGHQTD